MGRIMVEVVSDSLMEAYANGGIDEVFSFRNAATLSVRVLNRSSLAVTELKYDAPNCGIADRVPKENGSLPLERQPECRRTGGC
jgi:hypothetical protein